MRLTAEEAVERVAAAFDAHAATVLADAETVLVCRGATPAELALEIGRMRAQIEDARRRTLEHARAFAETGAWSVH